MAGYADPPADTGRRRRPELNGGPRSKLRRHHSGIALMLVLWILTLLTIIAIGLTAAQRTESVLARNQLAGARFRAAAEAGINWTVLNLLTPPSVFEEDTEVWVPDGSPRTWTFAGERLQIQVFNEASRIDLNNAERDLLVALFQAAGVAEDQVDSIADAIEDWRDPDDLVGLHGAEDGDYEDAGRSYGAKDGPFDSVEEVQLVLGIDRELYRTLSPALTVDAGKGRINEEFAPPLVQAALRGVSLEEVEQELDEEEREEQERRDSGLPDQAPVERGGPVYRIRITGLSGQDSGIGMEAVVRIQASKRPPYSILWQRFGLVADEQDTSPSEEDL